MPVSVGPAGRSYAIVSNSFTNAASGTVISPSDGNAAHTDLATGINTALTYAPIDGQRRMMGIQAHTATPPGSPADGQVWLVATGGTGVFAGKDKKYAAFAAASWTFFDPLPGDKAIVVSTRQSFLYDAAGVWQPGNALAGANSDITSLAGLTTALSVGQGGTGGNTQATARTGLGAAASGANGDITALGGLTTALSIAQGGTGATTAAGIRTALSLPAATTVGLLARYTGTAGQQGQSQISEDGSGNVGVVTAAPDGRFTVNAGSAALTSLSVLNPTGFQLATYHYLTTGGASVVRRPLSGVLHKVGSNDFSNYQGTYTIQTTVPGGAMADRLSIDPSGHITPGADNTQNFGSASFRLKELFAGTSIINTSDAAEKKALGPADDDLLRAALDTEMVAYQWLAAIELKGEDAARIHFGPTAQGFRDACLARGVDPTRIAAYCEDEVTEDGTTFIRHGLRLDQFDRLLNHARWLVYRGELAYAPPA
ncbi:DUF2793 domain-containing protein [Phreatobacter stygius]|uniref:DUF2793 domain-containing protein n=1 Tax=Phreatobacter stygius TaxID=1940610 RepID=A0A4D7BI48_9HYPH|nr:DUF2793 domain-containing protein [Phreatobacter stygius]QCI67532.1 DUF2793 domain-containing protein [Phreatobacter stygius]